MKYDEKALVEALHRGDRYACDEMVQQYSGRIYNMALRLTGHPNEAEEVLQETLIKACRGVGAFEGRSSLSTWLYRIATNNGLMRLRRKKMPTFSLETETTRDDDYPHQPQLQHWQWDPEAVVLSDELRQAMDTAVAMLPDTLKAAFVLRDLEGLSTRDAAEILNISPNSLKVRLHRARLILREHLQAYFSHDTNTYGGEN